MNPEETLKEIFRAAVKAADPSLAVRLHTRKVRDTYEQGCFRRILLLAFGKAAPGMALAALEDLGEFTEKGVVIAPHGSTVTDSLTHKDIKVLEAGHPLPDTDGERATIEAMRLLTAADEDTLVLTLVSGGGSSMLVQPYRGISLDDKIEITHSLLRAGAGIEELNTARKHLSGVKGGRLAGAAQPATVLSLIISDVIDDRLDVIASGPTAPDSTTYQDALAVFEKYSINPPERVISLLRKGADGKLPETPKPGESLFRNVTNTVICNNLSALEGASGKAMALGLPAEILSGYLSGEARVAGRILAHEALQQNPPLCLISGGETTVTVKGKGKGGRNMELALSCAMEISGRDDITILSAATDGIDGPTDAAGAIVDGNTVTNARRMGLEPEKFLRNNNSFSFFEKAGGLLATGPTGTNVMDMQAVLIT